MSKRPHNQRQRATGRTARGPGGRKKIPWRRKWLPMPVFLPGKSHGQRSLAGYSPWGHKESTQNYIHTDTNEGMRNGELRIKPEDFISVHSPRLPNHL